MRRAAALLLSLWAAASVASAQDSSSPNAAEANERVERGEQLYEAGDYDAALAEFEQAYELIGEHPSRHLVLFNIARAHERRFRYDLAVEYYERYLREGGPNVPRADAVRSTLDTLRGLLATVHVQVNVPAAVWLEDRQIGEAPGDVLLPGGRHTLELRATGYEPERREIQIAPRSEQTVEVTLAALADEFRGLSPAFFVTSLIVGAVAGLVGAGLGIGVVLQRGEIDDRLADPVLRNGVSEDDRTGIQNLALGADVAFGVAGLGAVLAITFAFITDWGGGDDEATRALAPWIQLGSNEGALGVVGAW